MANKILLIAMLLLGVYSASAQALVQRLVGHRYNLYASGTLQAVDSNTFTYSGSRGAVHLANTVFDTRNRWVLLVGTIKPDYRRTRTWDSNGLNTDMLEEYWTGTLFDNDSRNLYTYDANRNRLSDITQTWTGSSWDNQFKTDFTYNAANRKLSETLSGWNGSGWYIMYEFNYNYDANGFIAEELYREDMGSGLQNVYRYQYTNDVNGNVLIDLEQDWVLGAWVNFTRFNRTFASNNLEAETILQKWTSGAWVNESKLEYTYIPGTYNFITYTSYTWAGGIWDTASRQYFTYVSNKLVQDSNYLYTTGVPVEFAKTTYTHDANGNPDEVTFFEWNTATNVWDNKSRTDYDYNLDYNNQTRLLRYGWTGAAWQLDAETFYYYETYNAPLAVDETKNGVTLKAYPNPANNVLNIDFNTVNYADNTISIIDLSGREVLQQTASSAIGDHYLQLDVQTLAPGMYIAQLSHGNEISRVKFYKQ